MFIFYFNNCFLLLLIFFNKIMMVFSFHIQSLQILSVSFNTFLWPFNNFFYFWDFIWSHHAFLK